MSAEATRAIATREALLRRGKRLEHFTIVWNCLEALISVAAGVVSGSVALVGFGLDSVIEVSSGAALLWRLHNDHPAHRERMEQRTLRIVGVCFVALALYIVWDSGSDLLARRAPEHSIPGIVITALSLVTMPLLARAKRRVARQLNSTALEADSRQTDFCTYLSAIVLSGLLLNWLVGWWWADPVAALVMVPIIAREGFEALRGKSCGCSGGHCSG